MSVSVSGSGGGNVMSDFSVGAGVVLVVVDGRGFGDGLVGDSDGIFVWGVLCFCLVGVT